MTFLPLTNPGIGGSSEKQVEVRVERRYDPYQWKGLPLLQVYRVTIVTCPAYSFCLLPISEFEW
jgi:hypothetical protein